MYALVNPQRPHSAVSSSPLPTSSSTLSWVDSGRSASWGCSLISLSAASQWTELAFWLENSRSRGGVFWSPGLKDWETPDPPLVKPSPQPWREPSFRRPLEPEREAGLPGAEMSGSECATFLTGEGETGALRGSETVGNEFKVEKRFLRLQVAKYFHLSYPSKFYSKICSQSSNGCSWLSGRSSNCKR